MTTILNILDAFWNFDGDGQNFLFEDFNGKLFEKQDYKSWGFQTLEEWEKQWQNPMFFVNRKTRAIRVVHSNDHWNLLYAHYFAKNNEDSFQFLGTRLSSFCPFQLQKHSIIFSEINARLPEISPIQQKHWDEIRTMRDYWIRHQNPIELLGMFHPECSLLKVLQ